MVKPKSRKRFDDWFRTDKSLVKSVMSVRASFITKGLFETSQKLFNDYRTMLSFQYYEFWMSLALYNITPSNFVNLI